jgi:hypothetical protein
MNLRDLTCLERTANWLVELIDALRDRRPLLSANRELGTEVRRRALLLHKKLQELRDYFDNPPPTAA